MDASESQHDKPTHTQPKSKQHSWLKRFCLGNFGCLFPEGASIINSDSDDNMSRPQHPRPASVSTHAVAAASPRSSTFPQPVGPTPAQLLAAEQERLKLRSAAAAGDGKGKGKEALGAAQQVRLPSGYHASSPTVLSQPSPQIAQIGMSRENTMQLKDILKQTVRDMVIAQAQQQQLEQEYGQEHQRQLQPQAGGASSMTAGPSGLKHRVSGEMHGSVQHQ